MKIRKGFFSLLIIVISIWLVLMHLGEQKAVPPNDLALASTIYFLGCLPLFIFFMREETNIPYVPIFSIFYFIYYGLSIFNNYSSFINSGLSFETITRCLNIIIAGLVFYMLAFYSPIGKVADIVTLSVKLPWDYRKAYRLGVSVGFLGIFTYYLSITNEMPLALSSIVTFIVSLSRLGIAILFMLQLQKKLDINGKIILWLGLFIPRLYLDLVGGSTFPIVLDFMILFFLYFHYCRSIPFVQIIIVAAIFFAIYSARDEFRELTWYGGRYQSATPIQRSFLYTKLIAERAIGTKKQYAETYEMLSIRTDSIYTFAKVVELTPTYIPYWGGYTYGTLVTNLVPRFIMPDKPEKLLGQEFGHRYMLLDPSDLSTSYNFPVLIEMYVNFGYMGVIIGMFILGLIFRIFYKIFNHPEAGEGGFLISTVIFVSLLNLEGDFSLIFGNILYYVILSYIVVKRMRITQKR